VRGKKKKGGGGPTRGARRCCRVRGALRAHGPHVWRWGLPPGLARPIGPRVTARTRAARNTTGEVGASPPRVAVAAVGDRRETSTAGAHQAPPRQHKFSSPRVNTHEHSSWVFCLEIMRKDRPKIVTSCITTSVSRIVIKELKYKYLNRGSVQCSSVLNSKMLLFLLRSRA
jgi:hypothetical protein